MAALYASTLPFISWMADTLKPSTPRPWRAAFSYVGGFPAATHIGGCVCPPPYGFGRTFRGGVLKTAPSWEYSNVSHIFLNSQMTSSQLALVSSGFTPKVLISWDPAPRPFPNSNRPSDRWSSIATRSAMRTGWFVAGLSGKMPEPTWMRSVWASAYGMNDSLADKWEYS